MQTLTPQPSRSKLPARLQTGQECAAGRQVESNAYLAQQLWTVKRGNNDLFHVHAPCLIDTFAKKRSCEKCAAEHTTDDEAVTIVT